jgi:hypothetical protein
VTEYRWRGNQFDIDFGSMTDKIVITAGMLIESRSNKTLRYNFRKKETKQNHCWRYGSKSAMGKKKKKKKSENRGCKSFTGLFYNLHV